ncbi:MAG: rRNA maturation RNase YbeY [Anaerolineae bacterium]|nr:rRNA maturation RNase YbeY [Anaerolineae bacterium]
MSYEIEIQNELDLDDFPVQRVTETITEVLTHHDVEPGSGITLVVTTDEEVRSLNQQYRGVDAATDILSFPADPLPDEIADEADDPPYLGDLIVAYPYTLQHAEEAGHAIGDELVLLAIHGTLHLLGYDHDNAENQQKMWSEQKRALDIAKVKIDVPLFTFGDDEHV